MPELWQKRTGKQDRVVGLCRCAKGFMPHMLARRSSLCSGLHVAHCLMAHPAAISQQDSRQNSLLKLYSEYTLNVTRCNLQVQSQI